MDYRWFTLLTGIFLAQVENIQNLLINPRDTSMANQNGLNNFGMTQASGDVFDRHKRDAGEGKFADGESYPLGVTEMVYTTEPTAPSMHYPFGLTRWAFIVVCTLLVLACALALVCFISAVKAVRDRSRIKKRIEERQKERMRKEAEKEAAPKAGSDNEPLTKEEPEEVKNEIPAPNMTMDSVKDRYTTPSSHIVTVTVHDNLDNSSNGTVTAAPNPSTESPVCTRSGKDVQGCNHEVIVIDHDSAIESANTSDAENHIPPTHYTIENEGQGTDSLNGECNGNMKNEQNVETTVLRNDIVPEPSSKADDSSQWDNTHTSINTPNIPINHEINDTDEGEIPIVNENETHVSSTVVQDDLPGPSISTPERKKAGLIGTPPKFFSPKKRKDEKLVDINSPEGNEGLDNMAFDEIRKC